MKSLHGKSAYCFVLRTQKYGISGLFMCAVSACSGHPDELIATEQSALVGDAFPNLTSAQAAAFAAGRAAFSEVEGVADGLGPVFNDKSCQACHNVGATGGAGLSLEVRAGRVTNGTFDSLVSEGGQLFDLFSVTALPAGQRGQIPNCTLASNGEPVPADANVRTSRRTTALFGLGFVDATPDGIFQSLAAMQPVAIRGHVNRVTSLSAAALRVGKFGWKAQVPSLFQFSGDAYLNEMGITNPQFPREQAPLGNPALVAACDAVAEPEDDGDDVQAFTDFMVALAAVAPLPPTTQSQAGDAVFTRLGCDGCHVRTITAGASPIAAINHQPYHPYSDFLLHDMGSLGDGIGDTALAGTTEMRTAPLWGIRLVEAQRKLLHDGSAATFPDAILRHDGQGRAARDAYNALGSTDRSNLVAFLKTL